LTLTTINKVFYNNDQKRLEKEHVLKKVGKTLFTRNVQAGAYPLEKLMYFS
jgi:hypothetical protein